MKPWLAERISGRFRNPIEDKSIRVCVCVCVCVAIGSQITELR